MEKIAGEIEKDREHFKEIFKDCADIKMRDMYLGEKKDIGCFVAYIEVAVSDVLFEKSMIGKLLNT